MSTGVGTCCGRFESGIWETWVGFVLTRRADVVRLYERYGTAMPASRCLLIRLNVSPANCHPSKSGAPHHALRSLSAALGPDVNPNPTYPPLCSRLYPPFDPKKSIHPWN